MQEVLAGATEVAARITQLGGGRRLEDPYAAVLYLQIVLWCLFTHDLVSEPVSVSRRFTFSKSVK